MVQIRRGGAHHGARVPVIGDEVVVLAMMMTVIGGFPETKK
jgi:hypothetical protein